jgi:diguanylate cyclase (GGDEF)-like protein
VALFVLDVDHFKQVNDSLGHAAGDALLTAVGERLVALIRETDTIARMGGDEFVIVMPDFKSMEDVRRCGLQMVQRLAEPMTIEDREVHITVSVGVCTLPNHAEEEKELFKNADAAMYVVKAGGRNGLNVFGENESMIRTHEARVEMKQDRR